MLTCPQCGTSSVTNPRLQLLYSSCCGHCLCSDCIHTLFAAPTATTTKLTLQTSTTTTPCPACAAPVTPRDFDPAPLSTQRYTKEVKLRQRLNRLLGSLRREDFGSEEEWEEWKEWKEDVVWLVVEGGSKDDEKEAERRIDEWRKDNKDKLDKATAREREEERRAQLKAEGKVSLASLHRRRALAKSGKVCVNISQMHTHCSLCHYTAGRRGRGGYDGRIELVSTTHTAVQQSHAYGIRTLYLLFPHPSANVTLLCLSSCLSACVVYSPLIPSFQLPSAHLAPSTLHALDASIAAMEEGEERRKAKEERWAVWQRGRLSGGWKDEYATMREAEEMTEGWLVWT